MSEISNSTVSNDKIVVENSSGDAATSEMNEPPEDFKFRAYPNLEDIRILQNEFANQRNWNQYHTPRNLLLAMVGEVGELSELFQWRGEVKEGLPGWSKDEKEHLGQELSDILLYLIRLSEKCHIDLPAAVLKKIAMNEKKYPAPQVWGSNKKYTEYQQNENS